ncbi:MAG: RNA 2',3'-cyclic phosphodiesterase [Actinobacteria bacterium]|nr:RNA 2',3'-cyclic phosphodiesterase [Actinomycetota bacterium]
MPRLFVGLELSEEVREGLSELRSEVGEIRSARWITTHNLHLTLKFLGHVPDEIVQPLSESIAAAVHGRGSFSFTLGNAGAFPSARRASIIWYGLSSGSERVKNLAGAVEAAATRYGYPAESRPYHPHITIARIANVQDVTTSLDSIDGRLRGVEIEVKQVSLFESRLQRTGAEYSVKERFPV